MKKFFYLSSLLVVAAAKFGAGMVASRWGFSEPRIPSMLSK